MRPNCEECPLHINHRCSYQGSAWVPSSIKPFAPIALIGMAPGKDEVRKKKVFVGRAGKVLDLGLADHDIDREKDCSLINLLACRIPDNDWQKAGKAAVEACSSRFWEEVAQASPQLLVTLGKEPLVALDPSVRGKGLFYWRGVVREINGERLPEDCSSLRKQSLRLLPTYHPAALLYDPEPAKIAYFHQDLDTAFQEVFGHDKSKRAEKLPNNHTRRYNRQVSREGDPGRKSEHRGGRGVGAGTENASRVEEKEVAISRGPLPSPISGAVLDIETFIVETGSPGDRLRCIGVSPYERNVRGRKVRQDNRRRRRVWQVSTADLARAMEVCGSICGHNIIYDFVALRQVGALPEDWSGDLDDTMVLASLLNENREEQGLKTWAQEYGYGLYWTAVREYWKKREDPPDELLLPYNARDVALTGDLYQDLRQELSKDPRLTKYYDGFIVRAIRLAAELQLNGLYVYPSVHDEIRKVKRRLKYRADIVREAAGWDQDANINSTLLKRELLFSTLDLPRLQLTGKTRQPSLSRGHMEKLLHHDSSGVVKRYLELSFIQKQLSDLEQLRSAAGSFIHPYYNVGGTGEKEAERRPVRTGRWSAQNPNVQQFASYLKRHIGSRYPGGYIVQWDGDQIEVRVACVYSGDTVLSNIFRERRDPYVDCATAIFGRDKAAARRFMGKRSLLAAIFGVHENFLSESLNRDLINRGFKERVTPNECKGFLASVYARYSRHYEWIEDTKCEVRRTGEVRSLTGRVRRLPLARKGDWHSLNQAINFPIQSLANDLNLLAALCVGYRFRGGVLCTVVHDSGVADVRNLDAGKRLAKKALRVWGNLPTQRYFGFTTKIPLTITVSYGKRWAPMLELN